MNAQSRKKHLEKLRLERFLEILSTEFPNAEIIDHDREAPDFIVALFGRRIGIELTSVHVPGPDNQLPLQAEESMADEIIRLAHERYLQSSGPPVMVNAYFASLSSVRARDTKIVADRIAKLAQNLRLAPWQEVEITRSRLHEFDPALEGIIAYLCVRAVPELEFASWVVDRAGWHGKLTQAMLQDCVDKKAKRLDSYSEIVPVNWLVIVADRSKPSHLLDPETGLDWARVESPFDRTYFFSYPVPELIRLGAHVP